MTVVILYFSSFLVTIFEVLSSIFSLYHRDRSETGSNTAVIVVVVIVVIRLLAALDVFLEMKYKSKSPEITPSNGKQKSVGQVKHGVKLKKNKHSSSTAGMGERPGIVKMGEVQVGEKKKGRRKRSSSSPRVGVGSQIQLPVESKDLAHGLEISALE